MAAAAHAKRGVARIVVSVFQDLANARLIALGRHAERLMAAAANAKQEAVPMGFV